MHTVSVDKREIVPSKIVCVGQNYVKHIEELGNEVPDNMVLFMKPNSAIADTLVSFRQEPIHYEGELCFVVEDGRFSAVGFGLDLTKRALQKKLREKGLPWERAKTFNGAAVFSRFVDISDSAALFSVRLDINGTTVQSGDVTHMLYKPDEILAEIKTFLTLNDGDIVMTGTPSGAGALNKGDTCTGSILENGRVIVRGDWVAE